MSLFSRETKKKHIEQFENRIAELLENEFPQFKKVIRISKVYGVEFLRNPESLFVSRGYTPEAYKVVKRHHKTNFSLIGVSLLNNKTKTLEPIKLSYTFDCLSRIEVENPKQFHLTYDLNSVQIENVRCERLPIENLDREVAEKALKTLSAEQKDLLELEDAFEIEVGGKQFYTILDMEDGNYIAVDKLGKIYSLNHEHQNKVKKIADRPVDFFKVYNGQTSALESLVQE